MSKDIKPAWLDPRGASAYTGLGITTLEVWRAKGIGPRYTRIGSRIIRYATSDLDQFLRERSVETTTPSTSEESDGAGATTKLETESCGTAGPKATARRVKNQANRRSRNEGQLEVIERELTSLGISFARGSDDALQIKGPGDKPLRPLDDREWLHLVDLMRARGFRVAYGKAGYFRQVVEYLAEQVRS